MFYAVTVLHPDSWLEVAQFFLVQSYSVSVWKSHFRSGDVVNAYKELMCGRSFSTPIESDIFLNFFSWLVTSEDAWAKYTASSTSRVWITTSFHTIVLCSGDRITLTSRLCICKSVSVVYPSNGFNSLAKKRSVVKLSGRMQSNCLIARRNYEIHKGNFAK